MTSEETYFKGDNLAFDAWKSKYQYNNESLDEFFERIASEFAKLDNFPSKDDITSEKYQALSSYGQERLNSKERYKMFLTLFKDFDLIIPGGSVLAGVGSNKPVSLSNCFVLETDDSIEEIFKTAANMSQVYKRRGGVGVDLSVLRPAKAEVNNAAKTTGGVVPFMELYSQVTNTIGQDGRRGALMLSLDINHPDSPQFIIAKQNLTKITGANVSVRLNNEFMLAVKNDEDYILRWPCNLHIDNFNPSIIEQANYNELVKVDDIWNEEGKSQVGYIKKIKAKELWESIIHCAWNTAEPGILFWDNIINNDPASVYPEFKAVSTNPCVSGDTLVLTDEGYKSIESLVDKSVNIWNGEEFSEITPTITGYDQEMLKITFSDGVELKCTPYHGFYTWKGYERDGKVIKKEAKDLIVGDKLEKYSFPIINRSHGESFTTSDFKTFKYNSYYTLGFFEGDGHIKRDHEFMINLYGEKKKLLDKLNIIGNVSENVENDRLTVRVELPANAFVNTLNIKKYIPESHLTLEETLNWLAGLIDSDGSRNSTEGAISISSIDKQFLIDIKLHVLNTLGINSSVIDEKEGSFKIIKGTEYECNKSYRLLISAYNVKKLYELGLRTFRVIINNIDVNRDAARFIKITSIEKIENANKVYCFTEPKKGRGCFNGVVTANCGEIPLSPYDSCRLIAVNLFGLVLEAFHSTAFIQEDFAYETFYEAQILGDILVDLEAEAIDRIINIAEGSEKDLWRKVKEIGLQGRRTGVGVTGLADMLAALGKNYTDVDYIETIMRIKMQAELDATIDLAILNGAFPAYNIANEWDNFQETDSEPTKGMNQFYEFLLENYPKQAHKMIQWGRRNISWSTIAPTGTLSILAGTSSGCEPVFSLYYTRRRKCNPGETPDFVDQNGIGFMNYNVIHNKFKDWYETISNNDASDLDTYSKEQLDQLASSSPWYNQTAECILPADRVRVQSTLQKYITHSISSTVNVAKDVTEEDIATIYNSAYELGCKGITVYRNESRSGILIKPVDIQPILSIRPIELECQVEQFKNEKKDWVAFIGILNDKPYEIFTGPKDMDVFPIPSATKNGSIIKVKQEDGTSRYDFKYIDSYGYTNTLGGLSRIFNKEYWNYARFVSALLRSAVPIEQIVKIVEGLSFTNKGMNSWKAGIIRSLKPFIANGTKAEGQKCDNCGGTNIIYEGGCMICRDCGSGRCG